MVPSDDLRGSRLIDKVAALKFYYSLNVTCNSKNSAHGLPATLICLNVNMCYNLIPEIIITCT